MKLTTENLKELSNIALSASVKAGEFIANYPREQITVQSKTGGASLASQVVTEVDLRSQEIILEVLLPTIEQFDLALLTEESVDSGDRFVKDHFWCIDPLDGTLPFTENRAGYSVSIALVSKSGESLIGVVFDPVSGNLYSAIKGCGVTKNGKPWHHPQKQDSFALVCDRSFLKQKDLETVLGKVTKLAHTAGSETVDRIDYGGATMNAIWVLENAPAVYFKYSKETEGGGSLWDYAATACIFDELDCIALDSFGEILDLNRKVSTFMNHRGILFSSERNSFLPELLTLIRK